MSRQYKKLQKKRQQGQDLGVGEEEVEEQEIQVVQQKNFFAMNNSESEEEEEEEDQEELERQQREEEEEEERLRQEQEQQQQQQKKKKKNKKKNKGKQEQEDEEDFDKILEELNMKPTEEEQKQQAIEEYKSQEFIFQHGNLTLNSPLQLQLGKLNYNKELQKFFKDEQVVEEMGEEEQYEGIRDRRVIKQLKARQKVVRSKKQMRLVYGLKGHQPIPDRFKCETIDTNSQGQEVFAFFPTKTYEKLQETYEGLKNTMDPQNTFDFIQKNPFHVDAMFDVSEFFRLQGQLKQGNQLLTRIMYVYEDSFGPQFKQIFEDEENKFCLSFEHNKYSICLFWTILKFCDLLGKKGCFRAALEYNKFLLKLNPIEDPIGALLCLDYFAIQSNQFKYLEYFTKTFAKQFYRNPKYSIFYMPNYIFSYPISKFLDVDEHVMVDMSDLLKFEKEDFDQATDLLSPEPTTNAMILRAILFYPKMFKELGEKYEFQKQQLFSSVFQNSQKKAFKDLFENELFNQEFEDGEKIKVFLGIESEDDFTGFQKVQQVHVERSKPTYKNNQTVMWFKAAVGFLIDEIESRKFDYSEFLNLVNDLKMEADIIPFKFEKYAKISKFNFSENAERLDLNNIEQEEQAQLQQQMQQQQQGNMQQLNQDQGVMQQFLQSLLPWVGLPGQQQDQNVVYQDDNVYIEDEQDYQDWQDEDQD